MKKEMGIGFTLFGSLILLILIAYSSFTLSQTFPASLEMNPDAWVSAQTKRIKSQVSNINTNVLKVSLTAYVHAKRAGLNHKPLLTVIDFSKASNRRRLWVFDLKTGKTLFNTWVSHGKNSGGLRATSFSNKVGSLQSSLGVFLTDYVPYIGKNGYSLRLKGLEPGINDNAYRRSVVIHGARYVNADIIKKYPERGAGRSWGCPAVSKRKARLIIDTIKNKTLLVAYYPDRKWLTHSRFLSG